MTTAFAPPIWRGLMAMRAKLSFREATMLRACGVLVLWAAASGVMADEIRDLYTQQRKQKIAAERAAARDAKRKSRRPTKATPPKKDDAPSSNPISPKGHGITEIGSEFGFGLHTGPDYTLIVQDDGTFRFEGRAHVDHMGKWTGTIDRKAFDELADFIREAGYMDLRDTYELDATDLTPIYTTVVQDGKRHVIEDWGTGPKKLREIERRIYALLGGARWDEPLADPTPKSE